MNRNLINIFIVSRKKSGGHVRAWTFLGGYVIINGARFVIFLTVPSLELDLTRTMAKSRDYNELYWAWNSWREAAGQPSREDFKHDVMYRSMVAEAYGTYILKDRYNRPIDNM